MFQKQKQQKYFNKEKGSAKKTAFLSKRTKADAWKADDLRKHLWAAQLSTPRGSKKHKDLEMDVLKSKLQNSRDPDQEAKNRERVGDRDQPQLQGSTLRGQRQEKPRGKKGQSLRA